MHSVFFKKLLLKKQFLLLSTKTMSSTGVEKYSILERLNKLNELNEWIEISEEACGSFFSEKDIVRNYSKLYKIRGNYNQLW